MQVLADFRVIDESDDFLVVDKPAPLIVHPANRRAEPTLIGGVERLLAFEIANGARPGIVTRLDRETSGVTLVAKHSAAARELGGVLTRREAEKEYLAIVSGWPRREQWECTERILRAGTLGPSAIWVRQVTHPSGKPSLTRFAVERRFERAEGRFSLLRCRPLTGRMHQIRVHAAHSGHAVVGDKIYNGDGSAYLEWLEDGWTPALAARLWLARHALHAARLSIPWRGGRLSWRSPLPPDLEDFAAGREVRPVPGVRLWNRLTGLR